MNINHKRDVAGSFYACVTWSVPPTVDMWSSGIKLPSYTDFHLKLLPPEDR
jgi:hypothetical protein